MIEPKEALKYLGTNKVFYKIDLDNDVIRRNDFSLYKAIDPIKNIIVFNNTIKIQLEICFLNPEEAIEEFVKLRGEE